MIAGDRNRLGYSVIDPAIQVALKKVSELYPVLHSQITRNDYFLKGNFSCSESSAEMLKGSKVIYDAIANRGPNGKEFAIIFAPGEQL